MYEISSGEGLSSLVFELSWVRTTRGPQHLNGTCFLCDATGLVLSTVDFRSRMDSAWAVRHSGPSSSANSSQSLTVTLSRMGCHIRYLFFALSGFAPAGLYLSSFASCSVRLLEADTRRCLSDYTSNLGDECAEAMLLCFVEKDVDWKVVGCGRQCRGNHRNYYAMHDVIRSVIDLHTQTQQRTSYGARN